MSRKTIKVAQIREWANTRLAIANSTHTLSMEGKELTPEQAFRLGIASMTEQILHATGNYRGFGYNLEPGAQLVPGVTDETRRHYYH